MQGSDR